MILLKKTLSIIFICVIICALGISSIPTPTIYKANHLEIYDKNNNLINTEINNKPGEYIKLYELPPHTINAFISFEDKNFYKHHGFDFFRTIKSFFHNISTLSFSQGASTITQQYARTIFLNNERTIGRKIKEAYYTSKIEKKYSKNQILEGYLNTIYLGHGCYGIDSASRYYFNKSSKDLTIEESATLASLPSSPSTSSPYNNYNKAIERRNLVLLAMKKQKYINEAEYQILINKDIILSNNHLERTNLDYYLDQVKSLIEKLNLSKKKGLKIYTNIDLELYNKISGILNNFNYHNYQISLIILENNTNKILFDIGGVNYQNSSYNRSILSKRQIGSTVKTFLYSFALENNFTLETKLKSQKTTFNIKDYGSYSPSNSNNIYANRDITMKEAYAVSDNIYAVKTLLLLGSDNFIDYLKKFNLDTQESVPSIALGSSSFTLLDLAKAYSVFANNGYYMNYNFIDKITDTYNTLLYKNSMNKEKIVNTKTINNIKHLMTLPFYNNNYYTKSTLENYHIKNFYGKSGSTSSDSYLILFNEKYTIAGWLGSDDNSKIYDYTTIKYILKEITNKVIS